MLYLTFHIDEPASQEIKAWQLATNLEVLRWQVAERGRARVIRVGEEREPVEIDSVPEEPGAAEPWYGDDGGAYRFSLTPLEKGCVLMVDHVLAGNPAVYGPDVARLEMEVIHCLHVEEDPNPPEKAFRWRTPQYRGPVPERGMQIDVTDIVFWIDGEMMQRLQALGWTRQRAGAYQYRFRPHEQGVDIWARAVESGEEKKLTEGVSW